MKGTAVVKIKLLVISAALASTFAAVACSFGPDAYNGPAVCPGDPPPDTVTVPDGECWDGGGLPPDADAGNDADTGGGTSTAGGGGADTAGGSAVAGGAGTGGASTAGTGG